MDTDRLDKLGAQYLTEENGAYKCIICERVCRQKFSAKLHVESKHFPTEKGYFCAQCIRHFNTFSALKNHNHLYHKGGKFDKVEW